MYSSDPRTRRRDLAIFFVLAAIVGAFAWARARDARDEAARIQEPRPPVEATRERPKGDGLAAARAEFDALVHAETSTAAPVAATLAAVPAPVTKTALAKPAKFFGPPGARFLVDGVSGTALVRPPPPADAATLFGKVAANDGTPDEGAKVYVYSGASYEALARFGGAKRTGAAQDPQAFANLVSAECGADGGYRAEGLTPGPAYVYVTSTRFSDPSPLEVKLDPREEKRQDFALDPGMAVAGHVRDAGGAPLGGIVVATSYPQRSATTGGDGAFRITGLNKQFPVAMLSATDPSGTYATAQKQARPGDEAVEIAMQQAARVEVTVLSAATHDPVAGAVVRDATPSGSGFMFAFGAGDGAGLAKTDASGHATLEGLTPGAGRRIRAECAGYAPGEARVDLAPGATSDVEVDLGAGATVRGLVHDGAGAPLAGALVLADTGQAGMGAFMDPARVADMWAAGMGGASGTATASFGGMASTLSGDDGRFVLANLVPGKRTIAAGERDHVAASVSVAVDEGDATEVDLTLGVGGGLEGRAVDKDGNAQAGATVSVWSMSGGAKNATTADDGSYALRGLRPGPYTAMLQPAQTNVVIMKAGAMPDSKSVTIEEGKVAHLDFGVKQGGVVVTGALARGGKPYSGGVFLMTPGTASGWRSTNADAQGAFRFEDVPPADYDLLVMPTYRRRVHVTGDDAEVDASFALPALAIAGVVSDAQGNAIAAAQARLVRVEDRNGPLASWLAVTTSTKPDGSFEGDDLDDASYSVEVSAPGYVAARKTVASGASSPVAFTLQAGARVVGRVVDPLGEPVIGVILVANDEATGETRTSMTKMDSNLPPGEVELDGLPAGTYAFAAVQLRGGFDRRTGVRFDGQSELDVDFTIGPGGALALTAKSGAAPLANAAVAVTFPDGRGLPTLPWAGMMPSVTDSTGAYRRDRLPPGTYRVAVTTADGRSGAASFAVREEEDSAVVITVP